MPRVVHFEVHADDPARAAKFYEKTFGWRITQWGNEDYWLVKTGEADTPGIDGGIARRRGPPPANGQPVTSYVNTVDVESLDRHVDLVTTAGGQVVVPKAAVPGIGWLAYCKDTEGNIFGLMEEDPSAK